MLFAVLFFEDKAEQTIRQIWQALTKKDIAINGIDQDVSPHMTLGMFKAHPPENLHHLLKSFTSDFTPLPINMSNYGLFTSPHQVLFLGITVTDALYQLHRRFYKQFAHDLDTTTLFAPATYIPHCTLAYDLKPDKLPIAFEICQQFPLPIITYANRIALVESNTGQTKREFPFQ